MTGEPLEDTIAVLLRPSGDAGAALARGEALEALLARPGEAHPRLLELAAGGNVLALKALPRFGLDDSIPVLERALRDASAPTTVVAAAALSEHPGAGARTALEAALGDPREQVVVSAAMGLAERGDPAACPALAAVREHGDAEVRARIAAALARLGC